MQFRPRFDRGHVRLSLRRCRNGRIKVMGPPLPSAFGPPGPAIAHFLAPHTHTLLLGREANSVDVVSSGNGL